MKKVFLSIMSCVVLYGCAGSPARQQQDNTTGMLMLRPDMTTEQLSKVMPQPARTEMYRGKKNEVVLTHFFLTNSMGYVTNPNDETNYTPLIFVDNKLNGWGWDHLKTSALRYEFVIKHR